MTQNINPANGYTIYHIDNRIQPNWDRFRTSRSYERTSARKQAKKNVIGGPLKRFNKWRKGYSADELRTIEQETERLFWQEAPLTHARYNVGFTHVPTLEQKQYNLAINFGTQLGRQSRPQPQPQPTQQPQTQPVQQPTAIRDRILKKKYNLAKKEIKGLKRENRRLEGEIDEIFDADNQTMLEIQNQLEQEEMKSDVYSQILKDSKKEQGSQLKTLKSQRQSEIGDYNQQIADLLKYTRELEAKLKAGKDAPTEIEADIDILGHLDALEEMEEIKLPTPNHDETSYDEISAKYGETDSLYKASPDELKKIGHISDKRLGELEGFIDARQRYLKDIDILLDRDEIRKIYGRAKLAGQPDIELNEGEKETIKLVVDKLEALYTEFQPELGFDVENYGKTTIAAGNKILSTEGAVPSESIRKLKGTYQGSHNKGQRYVNLANDDYKDAKHFRDGIERALEAMQACEQMASE